MKKMVCLILSFLFIFAMFPANAAQTSVAIVLAVGDDYEIPAARMGTAEIPPQDIFELDGREIIGRAPGTASFRMTAPDGLVTRFVVTVKQDQVIHQNPLSSQNSEVPAPAPVPTQSDLTALEDDEMEEVDPNPADNDDPEEIAGISDAVLPPDENTPELIQGAIDLALSEWEENKGKAFSRLGSKNKFSRWQCGTGSGCDIGWCGAFVGYCLDNAGVPMEPYKDSVPHEDGIPYAVRAAGVGKIYTGYENMNRLTDIPRPGYLVIYGKKGGYAYLHVGMITAVQDNEDGTYLIQTVEGNVSNRIKRYCYLYDKNGGKKNFLPCPDDFQLDSDTFQYTPHSKDWMITTFCQTWAD